MPWVHAHLRGTKVLAKVDAGGAFVVENGRVEIRYKPNDGRKYGARADNLNVVSGEILPDDTCGPADGAPAKKAAASPGAASSSTASATAAAPRRARASKAKGAPDEPADGAHAAEPHAAGGGGGADQHPTALHVYADGACSGNPGPAGLGVVVLDGESRVELSEYIGQGTNNIAELMAILRALGETADSERPLVIHTDSSYSIGVLQKGWKAKANQELVAELRDALRTRKGVRLVYVPGHAGVKWNERADSLARAAVASRKSQRYVHRATPPAGSAAGAVPR